MLSKTVTVFVPVDHFTDVNHYLEQIYHIVNQKFDSKWTVDVVTITTPQVPEEVCKIYEDTKQIKSRFSDWPENVNLKYFWSDDHSYNKIRNYIETSGEDVGELITIKSIAPIVWLPNHIQAHIEEYESNKKKCGWMISRIEIKDISEGDNEKRNTLHYRVQDFPDHIDKIIPDEIFMYYSVGTRVDYNAAAVVTQEGEMRTAIFHAGKLLTDEIQRVADHQGLKGFNPSEITIQQWIDYKAIREKQEEMKKEQEGIHEVHEDGSVSFVEPDEDGSITFTEE